MKCPRRQNDFYSLNLNFQHNFNNDGHKLEAMAFYSGEEGSDVEEENERVADNQYQPTDQFIERVFSQESEEENEFRVKVDYTFPFSESGKVEAGMLSRLDSETESLTFQVFDEETRNWIIRDDFTSVTDFRRDIHAAYSTFSSSLGNFEFYGWFTRRTYNPGN
jgi:hypothetical protein